MSPVSHPWHIIYIHSPAQFGKGRYSFIITGSMLTKSHEDAVLTEYNRLERLDNATKHGTPPIETRRIGYDLIRKRYKRKQLGGILGKQRIVGRRDRSPVKECS